MAEFILDSNFVDEKKLVNDNEKIDFKNEKKYFSYLITFTQNLKDIYYASEVEKAKIKLNDITSNDRQLKEKKKKLEKKLEGLQKEIEKFREEKFELELKIDQYERQKRTLDAEFNSTLKLREMEIENKIKSLETELVENNNYLQTLKEERQKLKDSNAELQDKITQLEKETMKEISELDSQIGKADNDLEDVRIKVKEKQNNPKVEMMHKFFGEVKEYISKYKQEISKGDNIKSLKISFFDLQRQLNDKEFENSQAELKCKKKMNKELKDFKIQQENELHDMTKNFGALDSNSEQRQEDSSSNLDLLNAIKGKVRQMQMEVDELESKKERLEIQIEDHLRLIDEK
jgi:chromosome segregation ATPase